MYRNNCCTFFKIRNICYNMCCNICAASVDPLSFGWVRAVGSKSYYVHNRLKHLIFILFCFFFGCSAIGCVTLVSFLRGVGLVIEALFDWEGRHELRRVRIAWLGWFFEKSWQLPNFHTYENFVEKLYCSRLRPFGYSSWGCCVPQHCIRAMRMGP